jgi:hypothetical protein
MKIVSMSRDAVYDVLRERDTNTVWVRIWEGRSIAGPRDERRGRTRDYHHNKRSDDDGGPEEG